MKYEKVIWEIDIPEETKEFMEKQQKEMQKIVQDCIDSIYRQIELVYFKALIEDFSVWFFVIDDWKNPFIKQMYPINANVGGLDSI